MTDRHPTLAGYCLHVSAGAFVAGVTVGALLWIAFRLHDRRMGVR